MLVDGKWMTKWQPVQATDANGGFVHGISRFRHGITPDGSAGPTGDDGFKAEAGRCHLDAAPTRPWASRAAFARKPEQLDPDLAVSVVEPTPSEEGPSAWGFQSG